MRVNKLIFQKELSLTFTTNINGFFQLCDSTSTSLYILCAKVLKNAYYLTHCVSLISIKNTITKQISQLL